MFIGKHVFALIKRCVLPGYFSWLLGYSLSASSNILFVYLILQNPQMDLQAMDRCHRIGQTRPVHVYRLATSHSVEVRRFSDIGLFFTLTLLLGLLSFFNVAGTGHQESFWEVKARACGYREGTVWTRKSKAERVRGNRFILTLKYI